MVRSLYDCPQIPLGPDGARCRVVVATHPAGKKKSPVAITRAGIVYELFFTNLPQQAFTACDVVELYLHRGAFEPVLADEDREQDPDRWCSHSAWGQECWQLVSQWVPEPSPGTGPSPASRSDTHHEFALALPPPLPHTAPSSGYAPPEVGSAWKAGRFSGHDFTLQPDGTLRCPANQELRVQEQRREIDGSLRVVYGASIRRCRPCPLREQCQWNGSETHKPRQVSLLLHPLGASPAPLHRPGLEPQRVPACVSAPRARPARRGEHAVPATGRGSTHHHSCFSFPCAAGTQPPLVGDTSGSQCTIRRVWSSPHQAVWRSAGFCRLPRSSFVTGLFRRPLSVGQYRADPPHEQASPCKQAARPLA